MDDNSLIALRDQIEGLVHLHQVRVLNMIKVNDIEHTENANGVFVNMTLLGAKIIEDVRDYIKYAELQQRQLDEIELDKDVIKKHFIKMLKVYRVIDSNEHITRYINSLQLYVFSEKYNKIIRQPCIQRYRCGG